MSRRGGARLLGDARKAGKGACSHGIGRGPQGATGGDPDIAKRFDALYVVPMRVTVEAFAARILADAPKWQKVVKDAGIQPE